MFPEGRSRRLCFSGAWASVFNPHESVCDPTSFSPPPSLSPPRLGAPDSPLRCCSSSPDQVPFWDPQWGHANAGGGRGRTGSDWDQSRITALSEPVRATWKYRGWGWRCKPLVGLRKDGLHDSHEGALEVVPAPCSPTGASSVARHPGSSSQVLAAGTAALQKLLANTCVALCIIKPYLFPCPR